MIFNERKGGRNVLECETVDLEGFCLIVLKTSSFGKGNRTLWSMKHHHQTFWKVFSPLQFDFPYQTTYEPLIHQTENFHPATKKPRTVLLSPKKKLLTIHQN